MSAKGKRALAQQALDDSRTRVSSGTARCPCPQCEGTRGKRDGKLSLTMNLATSGFYCHRCGLAGYLDREAAELNQKARAYLAGPIERPTERDISDQIQVVRRSGEQFRAEWVPEFTADGGSWPARFNPNVILLESQRNAALRTRPDVMFFGKLEGGRSSLHAVIFLVLSGTEPSVNDKDGSYGVWGRHQLPGRLKGWVMRVLDPNAYPGPKYRNAPGMLRAECFFNEAAVYKPSSKPVVVVEGCFDACSRGDDGVAVLGKLSHWQKDKLIAAPRPVLIVPDGDAWESGRVDAMELAHHGQTSGFLKLPAGKDPDEYDQPTWDAMVAEKAEWF